MFVNNGASNLISIEEAKKIMLNNIASPTIDAIHVERINIEKAFNRILAEDICSPIDVPSCNNSAMDGFVIESSTIGNEKHVDISQIISAGDIAQPIQAGTAARIFTGAMLPPNADIVIAQENCRYDEKKVTLPESFLKNDNIRLQGQDVKKGEKVFESPRLLQAQDIGMLASLGLTSVNVFKPLRVALVSTGNELLDPGANPELGKIYNSNRFMLEAFLKSINVEVSVSKILADNLEKTKAQFQTLALTNDCLISTGGVSVGDSDFVKQALAELGELHFWKLAIKPGKPFSYGRLNGKPFFGLPGNPVAVFVTFLMLVKPVIQKLQGLSLVDDLVFFDVKANFEHKGNTLRQEYLRVSLIETEQGKVLDLYPNQSSGVLNSTCQSDGFAVLEIGRQVVKGDMLKYIPYKIL